MNDELSEPADELVLRFVERCVVAYTKRGLDRGSLARAMLATAINLMLEQDGCEETAHVLAGIAFAISDQPPVAGHG